MRSRIGRLTRSGFDSARDTVETATSASLATSCSVTVRPPLPAPGLFIAALSSIVLRSLLVAIITATMAIFCHSCQRVSNTPRHKRASVPVTSIPAAVPARTSVAWLIWTVGVLAYILTVMQRTTLAAAGLDAADRFGLSPGSLATFVFIQVAVFSVAQIPAGLLVDRYGPRSDARRQRGAAGLWADPAGACDNHARRRCGAGPRRHRRRDRLRGDVGAHPAVVLGATGARHDPADDDRRPTGPDPVRRSVRRSASPQSAGRPRSPASAPPVH